jgi:putative transposase
MKRICRDRQADYGDQDTLDQLLLGRDPKEVFSKDGRFDELKKALAERVLNAELDDHLDGEAAAGKGNHPC